MKGRRPRPGRNRAAPCAQRALPRCPAHLCDVARKEWRRLAGPLHQAGILSTFDRGALAAYCQAWARWVEAEEQLGKTPVLLKTPSGYVQQSLWLSIANKQMDLMGRYMAELGLTPSARIRLAAPVEPERKEGVSRIIRTVVSPEDRAPADPTVITLDAVNS